MSDKKKLIDRTSPFCPNRELQIKDHFVDDEDIITYKVVDKSVKTGDGPYDFVLLKEVIVIDRRNRQAELNKFAPDVGCLNVINKLARQGINAADGRFAGVGGFVDATTLPQDLEGMYELSKELNPLTSQAWNALPAELKKNLDIKQFAKQYNSDILNEFIKTHYTDKVQSEPKKEGE